MSQNRSKVQLAARIVLGSVFFVFGLNGFLHFIPQPPPSGQAAAFLGGLMASGYLFPLVKGIEVVTGLMLLSGRFVPLALTLLAPIVVNIVAFHLLLDLKGLPFALFVLGAGLYLAWTERAVYAPLFKSRSDAAPRSDRAGGRAAAAA